MNILAIQYIFMEQVNGPVLREAKHIVVIENISGSSELFIL